MAQVYDLKNVGTGVDKHQTYSNKLEIGTYDEENPFDLKDLKSARKDRYSACLGIMAMGMMAVFCILLAGKLKQFNKMPASVNDTAIMKDTIASDSLKILKDAFIK